MLSLQRMQVATHLRSPAMRPLAVRGWRQRPPMISVMSETTKASAGEQESLRRDVRTISLVGLVHGTSHFHHLLLPPMFPWFAEAYGLSYAELGLVVTVFFLISGVGQALSGFLVDRVGARPVLHAALACFVLSALLAAFADGHGGLLLASAVAGLGNAPFHPVDFTILNRRVAPVRLGHAYSVHGISGNIGWALSPLVSATLMHWTGSLRLTYLVIGLLGLGVLALVWWRRQDLDDRVSTQSAQRPAQPAAATDRAGAGAPGGGVQPHAPSHPLAFLGLPSVWLCFSFLFWTTCALSAVQSFVSPALQQLHGLPLQLTTYVVTGYMVCGAVGMVMGGFLLARVHELEGLIAAALLASALLLLVAAAPWPGGTVALLLVCLAGLGTGLAGPSRDMLIRSAAPAGATGRVYGAVYSALDLGFALSAPLFGMALDRGWPLWVFTGAAACLVIAVLCAAAVARRSRRSAAAVPA